MTRVLVLSLSALGAPLFLAEAGCDDNFRLNGRAVTSEVGLAERADDTQAPIESCPAR